MIYFLGLGSNLGEREKFIKAAINALQNHPQIELLQTSSLLETKPYGKLDQPDFLNCIIKITTSLSAEDLLKFCLQTESKLQRVRIEKWGPRTIDIDLLLSEEIVTSANLIIPHPELHKRAFVLKSMLELAPDFQHPILKQSMREIYEKL